MNLCDKRINQDNGILLHYGTSDPLYAFNYSRDIEELVI